MNKKIGFIAICLIVIGFGIKTWIDYQEKSLDDLIDINEDAFKNMNIHIFPSTQDAAWISYHNVDVALELEKELSQYRIKRIREQVYSTKRKQQTDTAISLFTIEHKGNHDRDVFIISTHFVVHNEKFYEVLNGPIGQTFFKALKEQFKKEQEGR